jgi:hypothetical protein
LMFYKLLIESSAKFRSYSVRKGIIEFVEPDENGQISRLEFEYDKNELQQMVELINGIWHRVQTMELPDTGGYSPTMAGIRKFEDSLRQK